MDTNTLLGGLMLATGVADILISRALGARLSPAAKVGLSTFGIFFVIVGAALSFGFLRLV